MRLRNSVFLAAFVCTCSPLSAQPIRGFPRDQWPAQRELEKKARALPQPERLRTYMERMSAEPHHAGSAGSRRVADYAAGLLKEWGLETSIETFEPLLPYPVIRLVEMVAPSRFRALLREPSISADHDTSDQNQLPPFNAFSASGDVTAPLVYVNYGIPEDYETLKSLGVDVKGKIVIARYGRSWRGVKPKLAQDQGAVGCLIYSDPRDDGFYQGDVYPRGPYRPLYSVQRGSVIDMAVHPGDPLTPGWAAESGARRLSREESKTLLKIPVLPISYGDAKPLLEAIEGPLAPEGWRGALPITYHIGPGPATVRLKAEFDWTAKPVNNVIATIPGSVFRDQWVIYGNHHDAWVNGATDPASGASVLLETARSLAVLRKQGWQPKRTIVLALWDGEEFGLMGSTEWVEKHKEELDRKALVYLNSDSTGRGTFNAAGSHSLERFLRDILFEIEDPRTGKPIVEAPRGRRGLPPGAQPPPQAQPPPFRLGALGAGSDYVAFIDHAGVPSLNLGFASGGGVYHSIYDTFSWYKRFSDGDFVYGRTLAQIMTTALIRMSDASLAPFDFVPLALTIRRYADEIQKQAGTNVDLSEITAQAARVEAAAKALEAERGRAVALPSEKLIRANGALLRAERTLLLPDGLPLREWYKHQIYAPGLHTGYGAKTLPGVREAVEAQKWNEASEQARRLVQVLKALTAHIEETARILRTAE